MPHTWALENVCVLACRRSKTSLCLPNLPTCDSVLDAAWDDHDGINHTLTRSISFAASPTASHSNFSVIAKHCDLNNIVLGGQMHDMCFRLGVHGAGLINHNFMKPNSSFVEITPCKFGRDWPSQYFQVPAEKERITFYWRLQAHKRKHCYPSPLQTNKGRNHPGKATSAFGIEFVWQNPLLFFKDIFRTFACLVDVSTEEWEPGSPTPCALFDCFSRTWSPCSLMGW